MGKWIFIFVSCIAFQMIQAQSVELKFILADAETRLPISGAHVFVDNSSVGTISDDGGYTTIILSAEERQPLILSHINYETAFLSAEVYLAINTGDTILMQANGVLMDAIDIVANRSRTWKRNYRKFEGAFLGEGRPASKCKILNPEVLRFEEVNATLKTTAVDIIEIENKHLGYNISFLLEESSIEEDGTSSYRGYANFENIVDLMNRKIEKLREQYYTNSLQHFLLSLIDSPDQKTLKEKGYQINIEKYIQGTFRSVIAPSPQDLIRVDSLTGNYLLQFSDFLAVEHLNVKSKSSARQSVSISGAEQQKFGTDRTQDMTANDRSVLSRLYKVEKYIIFNNQGIILNKKAYREYGYWADQRIASTLPLDYKTYIPPATKSETEASFDTLQVFLDFIGNQKDKQAASYAFIDGNWTDAYIAPLLDVIRMSGLGWHSNSAKSLLRKHVPQMKAEFYEGLQYLWSEPKTYGTYYIDFKAQLYKGIDPAFFRYFHGRAGLSEIRIDEVLWGGVRQDGIPPLRNPKMVSAAEASYLDKKDLVFGIVVNGKAYAYPKRILAWHEFFTDQIDDLSIAGVYCTLCGSVVIYNAEVGGEIHDLGTSGFLYRSNKLMYDKATQSLWSMLLGKPVVGPLANQDIELSVLPVESTDWASWSARYPGTSVLSIDTGYDRDYGTGVAYKDYYANDRLMFPVPQRDQRLKNKVRIFVPRIEGYELDPLGITIDFLDKNRLYMDQIDGRRVLILTEEGNASRAYEIGEYSFKSYKNGTLKDDSGNQWKVFDNHIQYGELKLSRVPAHEVFWFAWVNTFPETRLVR